MARASISPGEGFARFEGRLIAYARSQDLLFERGGTVTLHQLISAQKEFLSIGNNLIVHGPKVTLRADIATEISIALHELVTNSLKYGALGDNSRVEIGWTVEAEDARNFLHLSWHEQHGRTSSKEIRRGFGSRVLGSHVGQRLNGVCTYELSPDDVRWSLRAELKA
jgi:two-component sensor histidine kinase